MFKKTKNAIPASPCGLAFDQRNGIIVIAEYSQEGGFDIQRAVIGERRAVNILSTDIRTTVTSGRAHTKGLALPLGPDPSDETILRALVENSNPTSRFAFNRTPDGKILVTEASYDVINETVKRTQEWLNNQKPDNNFHPQEQILCLETRTRVISRLWRNSQADHEIAGATAFLVTSTDDYAMGLWSEESGLVYENEEIFERGASDEIKCQHARNEFLKCLTQTTIAKLNLPEVTNIVISAPESYLNTILALLHESVQLEQVKIEPISLNADANEPLDQPTAFAIGALLNHVSVPQCNLALSPETRLQEIHQAVQIAETVVTSQRSRTALLALLIPLAVAAAFLIIMSLDGTVEAARLNSRIAEESATELKLKQENADYESSKANFGAFQTLINKIISLREHQPATAQLLIDLNERWPNDPTWYVQQIDAKGGNVEIKGKTKNEQAITSFAKSLEFSNGLFSGILTRNNVEGNAAAAQQNQPQRSGVIEFTITATYAPLATPGSAIAVASQSQPVRTPQLPQLGNNPLMPSKPSNGPAALPSTSLPSSQMKTPEGRN